MGVQGRLGYCDPFAYHIRNASEEPYHFSDVARLPKETIRRLYSRATFPHGHLVPFWNAQLPAASLLVESCIPAQSKWGSCAPPEIRPEARMFQTVAIKKLLFQNGFGAGIWLGQFAFGFPITDHLSQKHLFAMDGQLGGRPGPEKLYETDRHRSRERAAKSGHKNAHVLRREAMAQVRKV